jgi:predicted lipoprotein
MKSLVLLLALFFGCVLRAHAQTPVVQPPKTHKDQLLHALVENTIAPGYVRLAERCRRLAEAAGRFDEQVDAGRLETTRTCWVEAARAAQEVEACRIGPITEGGLASTFYFLPARPASIERAILAMPAVGDDGLAALGAAAKGLYAMEYLLFPEDPSTSMERFSCDAGGTRRHYLHQIAREAADRAERLSKDWQAPYSPTAVAFLNGGQDSLNALVNRMVMTADTAVTVRLASAFEPSDRPDRGKVPGSVSGHSHLLLEATVKGLRQLHEGGVNVYARRLNAPLADRLDQQFASAMESLARLNQSPESQDRSLLTNAACQCTPLGVLLKVDLASSLGVTLTFISTDGD